MQRLIAAIVSLKLALHVLTRIITPYGVHRDELLYIAMGEHLSLWRMDFPPFIAILANVQRALTGDTLWGIRVASAIAGTLVVWLGMDIARRLGAGKLGVALAGITLLTSPLVLRVSVLFQPVVFDQLWWTLALWGVLRRGESDDPRWWVAIGAALGMGLLTKFSIAFVALPLALALIATSLRKDLATRWPWLGAGVAGVIGAPSLVGQVALEWPMRAQMADLQSSQLSRVTTGAFLGEQVLMIGPAVVMAIAGAWWLMARRASAAERTAGIAAVAAFGVLLWMHGKPYYAGPVYPLLLGAGAVALEALGRRVWEQRARVVPATLLAAQLVYGAVGLPLGLPIVEPEAMARYSAWLGVTAATRTNTGEMLELPQDYADMLGWEVFADSVVAVWRRLPAEEQGTATLLATNYGRAGAIDWYGRRAGLPPVVAPVGSYWFWGPGERAGDVVVVAGSDSTELSEWFGEVRLAAVVKDARRAVEEREVGIYVVRGARVTLKEAWPRFRGEN